MRIALISLWILTLASTSGAQVVAKQGSEASTPVDANAFHSPMVLETDFAAGDRVKWPAGSSGSWFTLHEWWELGKFSCDGVFFRSDLDRKKQWDPGIRMRVKDLPGGQVQVEMEVAVQNPKHNHDKMVSVRLDAVNGEESVKSEIVQFKAPDNGEGQQEQVTWSLPAASLQPTTRLRITMTTKDY